MLTAGIHITRSTPVGIGNSKEGMGRYELGRNSLPEERLKNSLGHQPGSSVREAHQPGAGVGEGVTLWFRLSVG